MIYDDIMYFPKCKLEYGYPHFIVAFLVRTHQELSILSHIKGLISDEKSLLLPVTSDVAHKVRFLTVYRGIYCRKLDIALHWQVQ